MTRPSYEIERVRDLAASGMSKRRISEVTEIPRSTIREWLRSDLAGLIERRAHARVGPCDGTCGWRDDVDHAAYSYLLGLYLGDGCISKSGARRTVFRLRIFLDDAYPGIINASAETMGTVLPNRVFRVQRVGCTEVASTSKHWPCLFPQHGPGVKHERLIVLEPWQVEIALDQHPEQLLRGLIHSDGCRDANPVNGRDYPRYQFSNRSQDIRLIFIEACRRIGVMARSDSAHTVSVARRASVAILDEFIGPKR